MQPDFRKLPGSRLRLLELIRAVSGRSSLLHRRQRRLCPQAWPRESSHRDCVSSVDHRRPVDFRNEERHGRRGLHDVEELRQQGVLGRRLQGGEGRARPSRRGRVARLFLGERGTYPDSQYISLVLTFGPIQLITYDALGLCEPGQAHKLVERGDNTVCLTVESHHLYFPSLTVGQ